MEKAWKDNNSLMKENVYMDWLAQEFMEKFDEFMSENFPDITGEELEHCLRKATNKYINY